MKIVFCANKDNKRVEEIKLYADIGKFLVLCEKGEEKETKEKLIVMQGQSKYINVGFTKEQLIIMVCKCKSAIQSYYNYLYFTNSYNYWNCDNYNIYKKN